MLGNFAAFLSSVDLFLKSTFFRKKKKPFGNTIRVSNSLDPDQARRFLTNVGPDLGADCLQRLTVDDKNHH